LKNPACHVDWNRYAGGMIHPFSRTNSRRGSALLLVLAVLVGCTALTLATQRRLLSRGRLLEQERDEVELRGALLLGLREGMTLWSQDEDLTVDYLGEDWAQPREWITSSGVRLQVQLRDAQDRWNLNHLTLPVTPGMVRTPRTMFQELLRLSGEDVREWTDTLDRIERSEPWFSDAGLLAAFHASETDTEVLMDRVVALPHPRGRFLPLNLNTVHPQVLRALVGDALAAWVERVEGARVDRPIRSVDSQTGFLPGPARILLSQVVSVTTSYMEVTVVAETDTTRREMSAILYRATGGDVEVIRCQW